MRIDVITLFPEFIESCALVGVVGRAQSRGLFQVNTCNPRDFATDNHRTVDSRPFGGGPGMLMAIAPLRDALASVQQDSAQPAHVVCMSPQGSRLTQQRVMELARLDRLVLVCGRYEGIDERVLEHLVDEELSVGDYVLSGGELAAAIVIDAIGRLQDGALNDALSAEQDSFNAGLLDCPHYTRPVEDELGAVPQVLLSGDHESIRRWRRKQALGRTWLRRPDLLMRAQLSASDRALLEEFRREYRAARTGGAL